MAQTDLVSDGSVELLLLLVTSRSGLRGLGLCDPKGARCYGVSARLRSHAVKAFTQSTYWKRGSSMVMPLNSSQRKQFSTDSYPTSCPPPQKKNKKHSTARRHEPRVRGVETKPQGAPKICAMLLGSAPIGVGRGILRQPHRSLHSQPRPQPGKPFFPPPGVTLPYSRVYETDSVGPGSFPFFRMGTKPTPSL